MAVATLPSNPDGLGHAILALVPPIVPVVLPTLRRPRPALRRSLGSSVHRGGPRARPAHDHYPVPRHRLPRPVVDAGRTPAARHGAWRRGGTADRPDAQHGQTATRARGPPKAAGRVSQPSGDKRNAKSADRVAG